MSGVKGFSGRKSKFEDGGYLVTVGGKGPWGDTFYAPFVELGTPGEMYKSGKRKGSARVKIKKKAFMRPELKRNKSKIKKLFVDTIDKNLSTMVKVYPKWK